MTAFDDLVSLADDLGQEFDPAARPGSVHALAWLPERVAHAAALGTEDAGWRELLDDKSSVVVVGTGGSHAAAEYVARLLRRRGTLAVAAYPLDAEFPAERLVIVSYSGRSPDCLEAIRRFRARGGRHVTMVTGSTDPDLAAGHNIDLVLRHRSEGSERWQGAERGFISFAATAAPCAAAAAAAGIDVADVLASSLGRNRLIRQWALSATTASVDLVEVVATGWARPAAIDLESKWAESDFGPLRLHEHKDFAHGRYVSVFSRDPVVPSACLWLRTPPVSAYEEELEHCFGEEGVAVEILEAESAGPSGGLELLLATQVLGAATGWSRKIDISRPAALPACAPRLYGWTW